MAESRPAAPSPRLAAIPNDRNGRSAPAATPPVLGRVGLPAPVTPLVGREREVAEVAALLADVDVRLVTLTGPGGVGKTRLALAGATEVRATFPGGVWLVSLAPVRDPALVAPAVVQAMGLVETARQTPDERVRDHLCDADALLVLDNCEHLLDAVGTFAAGLLAACAGVKVLATSREPLHLMGEHTVPVPPLTVPQAGAALDAVVAAPATVLFAQRARAARHDFALTAGNVTAVAAICTRLDGLPLALELAAAQVRHLAPGALLARLAAPLPVLRDGPRDSPGRHRTLAATIAWSHDLLTDVERRVFRRLAVFAGGWTLDAAEAVCGDGEQGTPVAEVLASLSDKSLVREATGWDGEPRYTMLETIREFAADELARHGETEAVAERRDMYFVIISASTPDWIQENRARRERFERVRTEDANLQLSLHHLHEQGEYERGLRLLAGIGMSWCYLGFHSHVRYWVPLFAPHMETDGQAAEAPIHALVALATAFHFIGEYDEAIACSKRGVRLARAFGDAATLALTLTNHAAFLREGSEYDRSAASAAEAVAIARGVGEPYLLAAALLYLAATYYFVREHRRADAAAREALALRHQFPGERLEVLARHVLAYLLLERGTRDEADRVLRDGPLVLVIPPGDSPTANAGEIVAAQNALRCGEYDRATTHAEAALRLTEAHDADVDRAFALVLLSAIALARGDYAAARRWADEGMAPARRAGSFPAMFAGLLVLTRCHRHAREYVAARRHLQGALTFATDPFAQRAAAGQALEEFGRLALDEGDTGEAAGKLFAALHLAHAYGDPYDATIAAALLAISFGRRGQHADALRLWAAADAAHQREGTVPIPADRMLFAAGITAARAALGDDTADAAWAAGRAAPLETLINEAGSLVAQFVAAAQTPTPPPLPSPAPSAPLGLTEREAEVLRLVAAGLTNGEVADRLFLSVRTVTTHLTSIYGKLDVTTRGAAIRLALDHGLR